MATRTARVVIFMPPAVEPGAPPISISTIITALEAPCMPAKSAVLKPAVLGVTVWKREHRSLSLSGISANSKAKKYAAGSTSKNIDAIRTILLCRRYFLKWNFFVQTSSQVKNPIPPSKMSSMIITFTGTFPAYPVRDTNRLSVVPSRSKPPLQKADTE